MLACSNTSQCKNCTQRNVDKSGKQRHTTIASKRSEVSFSIQYYGMKWMSTNGMMGTKILTANNNSIKSVIWKQILYSFTALIIMRWSFWSVRSHHTTVYTSHNRSRAAKEQRQQQRLHSYSIKATFASQEIVSETKALRSCALHIHTLPTCPITVVHIL